MVRQEGLRTTTPELKLITSKTRMVFIIGVMAGDLHGILALNS